MPRNGQIQHYQTHLWEFKINFDFNLLNILLSDLLSLSANKCKLYTKLWKILQSKNVLLKLLQYCICKLQLRKGSANHLTTVLYNTLL